MDPTLGILNPVVLTLGVSQIVVGLLTVGFLACSVLLILTVLIQRPQGGGLSGAFGAGAGSGETAFGARTGDALTIATISFFVLWLAVAVGLVLVMSGKSAVPPGTNAVSNAPPAQPNTTGGTPAETETPAGNTPTETPAGDTPAETPAGDSPADTGTPTDDAPAGDGAEQPTDDTTPPTEGPGDPAGDPGQGG